MNEKEITLSFDLEQVANDILTKCNQISKTVRDEALEDIRADIQEPDSPESRSIINRALTEAFGDLKVACQRYLKTGRTADNNLLERMVTGVTYVNDANGHPTDEIDTVSYETVEMKLYIPNFNVSVTAALESNCHKYLVQYVLSEFLADELAEKGGEYAERANITYSKILKNLNARDRFNMRKPSWI